MVFSIEADSKIVIIVIDRLEQERARLLALREKVSDAERARLSSVRGRQRTIGSVPSRLSTKNHAN
jgi:hypothetical protein